ncbi:MAG TPA: hypothetical protein VII58_14480 [Acidobacteriaceae bacterium]
MEIVAILLLCAGCAAYIFWPRRNLFTQADKTRIDSLRERKDAIYENLRDLSFEHQAGKFTEADYEVQRRSLEDEATAVIAEMELLEARGMRSGRTRLSP